MRPEQFEPMSVGGILDRAFTLYRRRFLHFLAIVAIVQVPLGLGVSCLLTFTMFVSQTYQQDTSEEAPVFILITSLATVLLVLISVVGQQLSSAALFKSVSDTYLNRETTVGGAYRLVLRRLLALVVAAILVGLVVAVGYLLCVVPGVIFSLWFALTAPAIVLEGIGPIAGMKRSKDLAKGNLGKIFLVLLVVFLITFVLGQVFNLAGGLVRQWLAAYNELVGLFAHQVLSFIAQIFAMPLASGATILIYYDLRIRKEAFDLEMLAQGLTAEESPPDVDGPQR